MDVVKRAAALVALAACGDPGTIVAPVIDLPAEGSDADPRSVDELELSVARAGSDTPLVSAVFTRGPTLALDGVPLEDDLVVHLVGRQAGGEIAYGRTCRFAILADADPPAPHLWFSRVVAWSDAPAPPTAGRDGGAAWTTAQDDVALALGDGSGGPVTAVDLFDVDAATWSTVAAVAPRTGGVLAPLGDGRAVIVGGTDGLGTLHGLIETVDPYAVEATRVQSVSDDRLGLTGAAATLAGDEVIVIGGQDAGGSVDTVYSLTANPGSPAGARLIDARLAIPRHGHTITRLSDDVGAPVVVIGGIDGAGSPVGSAELYRPLGQAFSAGFTATLAVPRSGHAAIRMPGGAVLVVGGIDAGGTPVRELELFTIDGGFVSAGLLPATAGVVGPTLTPLPDGRVLLSGGRTSTSPADPPTARSFVLRLDPLDQSIDIAATDDLDAPRARHATALLCDGTVLAVGGDTAERYQPPTGSRR